MFILKMIESTYDYNGCNPCNLIPLGKVPIFFSIIMFISKLYLYDRIKINSENCLEEMRVGWQFESADLLRKLNVYSHNTEKWNLTK